MSDLAQHILQTPLADTHEHLEKESKFIDDGPDVLQDLFDYYPHTDLILAGASPQAVVKLLDSKDPDIEERWEGVRHAWEHCQYTGYGQSVCLMAKEIYGIDNITKQSIESARERNLQLRKPGGILYILKEIGNIDHVQIDNFSWSCQPNPAGLDFFFYDINWAFHSSGMLDLEALKQETKIEVVSIKTLKAAFEKIFEKYAKCAIAVKTQYAYNRTLYWQERGDADVDKVLQKQLHGYPLCEEDRLCLGDWSLASALEMAIAYNLPFKIHTGILYDYGVMNIENVKPSHLCKLLIRYPNARFVLLHSGYPYSHESIGIAKHFPNVYLDLCWAWAIDPYNTCDFLRHIIHTLPTNKIFAFGGDTHWPSQSVAYAMQARNWLTYTLNKEIDEGFFTEPQAIKLATLYMQANQMVFFNLLEKRKAVQEAYATSHKGEYELITPK